MKFRLMSDIHTEFGSPAFIKDPPVLVDDKETILLLAGDIGLNDGGIKYANSLAPRFKAVCVVLGNHEFYNHDFTVVPEIAEEAIEHPNVHLLDNSYCLYDDVVIIGSTLWTSFNNRDPMTMLKAQRVMSDYHVIKYAYSRKLTPEDVYVQHQLNVAFLELAIKDCQHFNRKLVVMTHHLPVDQCIHPTYKGDSTNPMYSAGLDKEMERWSKDVSLWVFGHSHTSHDSMIGTCRMVSNPFGYYKHEVNDEFDPTLVIEV